jgi:diacylglycerol kinase family enzyme
MPSPPEARMIHLVSSAQRFRAPTHPSPARGGVAVLLNARAKAVTRNVLRTLSLIVPREDLFVSHGEEEASEIADWVVARRYQTVFTGGGDGTFVAWINRIIDAAERRHQRAPRFGVLALGTGNAVAEMVGATPRRHARDLSRFLAGEFAGTRRIDLVTCEGRRTPFAGVGIDAAILNDYNWVKEQLAGTPLQGLGLGAAGYGLAVALRSAPRTLLERRPAYCEIVNTGREAWRLDGVGRRVGPAIGPGELLHAGPCRMAGASTVPFYGMGMRIFPHADKEPGLMHLRVVSDLAISKMIVNLPSIWAGDFIHPKVMDFHADQVALRFERPVPLQVGGDAEGWRETVSFGMAPAPVELVDFRLATA